ncbi:unnamed protein product [Lasius platythorax]|uniref:Uncharacterized protein n=1 Tax=Lasius platythorax TaxID=488582 RepID=A0AAV2N132_9HYME
MAERLAGPLGTAENPLSAVLPGLPRETNMAVRQPLELQRLHLAVAVLYHKINITALLPTPRVSSSRVSRGTHI